MEMIKEDIEAEGRPSNFNSTNIDVVKSGKVSVQQHMETNGWATPAIVEEDLEQEDEPEVFKQTMESNHHLNLPEHGKINTRFFKSYLTNSQITERDSEA